ncbi:MAG: DUF4390 domain-containing protein [Gammaproteobacteria bacterium]|nr:DUF4390 domain-containing protein [Gammaproteobacteria bacterium]
MYKKEINGCPVASNGLRAKARGKLRRCILAMLIFMAPAGAAIADGFVINHAELVLSDKVYHLNANLAFDFSNDVLEAINNGVPLVLELVIEILEPRRYWWDNEIASLEQRYHLQYHALSEQYLVRNLNSGAQYTYFSLSAALQKIGSVANLPVIDEQLLQDKETEKYYARIRTSLSFDNLPLPLKIDAWTSRSWWLGSEWIELNL